MKIKLPPKIKSKRAQDIEVDRSLTIIGANGAGKSKFGQFVVEQHKEGSILLSALHSLYDLRSKESPEDEWTGSSFDQLMAQLLLEEYTSAMQFKEGFRFNNKKEPEFTRLDRMQQLWAKLMINSRIVVRGHNLEILNLVNDQLSRDQEECFIPSRMSEGEKIIFYFISSVLFAQPDGLIVIDEPEMHLHRTMINALWDMLEEERPDCTFVYLTNDISFASSRTRSTTIWVRSFSGKSSEWEYEIMKESDGFSQEIYLEILGSRKPILFIEGNESSSLDIQLYPHIFPEYSIKPLGGCTRVIESTKAINDLKTFHLMQAKGIVDRDRRSDDEVVYLRHHQIYVPNVAEVENLLMLPAVIQTVAKRRQVDPKAVFEQVSRNLFHQFNRDIAEQVMLHVRHQIRKQVELTFDKRTSDINAYEHHIRGVINTLHPKQLYERLTRDFHALVKHGDYMGVLKVYNQKSMLRSTRLFDLCEVDGVNGYISTLVTTLRQNDADAEAIRRAIKRSLGILEVK